MATTRKRWLLGLAAGVLAMTGCGGVERDATYKSTDDLIDAAIEVGYSCPNRAPKEAPVMKGAHPSMQCLSDNRDQFVVFATAEEAEAQRENFILGAQMIMVSVRVEMAVLAGPNWMIRGPVQEVKSLQEGLGGYLPDMSDVRMPSIP